jgi:hypothetical protein
LKNIEKPITWVTDDEWSGTVEMLLGLDADQYSYDNITDNLWPFKIRNREKENKYIQYPALVFAEAFSRVVSLLR